MSEPSTPTVTAIDPLPRDPNLRRIRIGRRTVGTIPAQMVEALRLRVGTRWTERTAARVAHAEAVAAARRTALRLLGRSAVASATLRIRLRRHEIPPAAADQAVDELLADGWIDDDAFARAVAEAALRRGPLGEEALAARLCRRGVDEALARTIAESLSRRPSRPTGDRAPAGRRGRSATSSELAAPLADALKWAEASLRRAGAVEPRRAARRIATGLARRGIDEDTIASVLDRLRLGEHL